MNKLTFEDVTLSVIDKDGKQWLTTTDIARALYPYKENAKGGYQSEAPFEKRVRNLYSRHKDEFTSTMTALIEVQTNGGKQKVRVFSLRGAHLLGMLSRTERAKQFRRWVLDIIERHNNELGLITTEYHQTLAIYATSKATASVHGKGLNNWKKRKAKLEDKLQILIDKMQPDLFLA